MNRETPIGTGFSRACVDAKRGRAPFIDVPQPAPPRSWRLDYAAFRRNRLNAENVIDSKSIERA
jgi:hypothetical protein